MTPTSLNWYGLKQFGFDSESLGLTGNMLTDQVAIEALCVRIRHAEHEGGLGPFGHFKNYVDLLWNNPDSGSQKRFVWNPWANRMLRKAFATKELGVAGPTSAGKCCSPEQLVLMFDGSTKRFDEIRPGDLVMGDDATPRRVREVHRGHGPMFKVIPAQGDPWYCTENHVLVLKRTIASKKSWRRMGEIVEIEAKDFASASHMFRRSHKQFCAGVDFPEQPIPLDPRLMGLWIGDGHVHNPRISIDDSELGEVEYVHKWANENGYTLVRHESNVCKTCPSYGFTLTDKSRNNRVKKLWKSCIKNGEKRIPREYLINSKKIRLELLAGIIDTDGYASRTFFEIATKYEGLKDDIVFLARSLGFRVSAVHRFATCNGKKFPSWRISICGNVSEIPTLRKKCKDKTVRPNSECTGITLEPAGDMDWVGFSVDGNHRFLLGDFTVTHNSDPFALYAAVMYSIDPTHTLVFVMSTTIAGAKRRIWKTLREYWESIPGLPGHALWSTNEIKGLNYQGTSYGQSSGIYLLASEQSAEKTAVEKLIGAKAPRTGEPDESFEALMAHPDNADLIKHFDEDTLRDLLPRLYNLSADRIGSLIIIFDEMTGAAESLLNAINTNLKPGNVGHFQIVGLGNPSDIYNPFGVFCKPKGGWDRVDLIRDDEWETQTGGLCIRFNGEQNPRITEGNERYSWMLRQADIDGMAAKYGSQSLFYHRMVLGTWCLTGDESGVYSAADIEMSGSKDKDVVWGYEMPIKVSFLDPSFTAGGDLAWATFGELGIDFEGKKVLLLTEDLPIQTDTTDTTVPITFQIAKAWKRACEDRGVKPQHAAYDRSGGGIPFGDIVNVVWSPAVTGMTAGGSASRRPVPGEKTPDGRAILACEKFENKSTEVWFGAHPFFRSHQIKGVSDDLAKELCSRHLAKGKMGDGKKICVENKRSYKDREGKSPDQSDSFLGLVDFCRDRLGFECSENTSIRGQMSGTPLGTDAWKTFRERARRLTKPRNMSNKQP